MAELESNHAAAIVDLASSLGGRSIAPAPAFTEYLKHYCPPATYDGVKVFLRPDPVAGCH
jgi:hypothetical protein